MAFKHHSLLIFIFLSMFLGAKAQVTKMQKLKVASNNRFLVKEDGSPFVWIGETNWFFAKLTPSTIDNILDVRSKQGFTIMFVSCRENLYNGEGPGNINQPNEAWWAYLDDYIAKCAAKNLYVGVNLGWWGVAKKNSASDLYNYGKWVGERYKDNNNIIWLTLGEAGSHARKSTISDEKIKAIVDGIRKGDTGNKLLTIHADYKRGTSLTSHGNISDFNNWQTSQWCCMNDLPRKDERNWTVWEAIKYDYDQRYEGKPKPTLDSEAWYENNKAFCDATAFNIRRRAYFTIFAGAFGHTYGAGGLWDGLNESEGCSGNALEAIQYEGARDMGFLSNFLHGLGIEILKLRPNQSFVVEGNSNDYDTHIQSTMAKDASFALIYSASDAAYMVDLSLMQPKKIETIWYNPRDNSYKKGKSIRSAKKTTLYEINPPSNMGAGNDWVLILGDKKIFDNFLDK